MTPKVICKYRKDIDESNIFCEKIKEQMKSCYCTQGHCKSCEFPTVAEIKISVGRCDQCPMCETNRTIGAGYALDYFCKAKNGERIAHYIEYDFEIPPVPEWCPFRKEDINA